MIPFDTVPVEILALNSIGTFIPGGKNGRRKNSSIQKFY